MDTRSVGHLRMIETGGYRIAQAIGHKRGSYYGETPPGGSHHFRKGRHPNQICATPSQHPDLRTRFIRWPRNKGVDTILQSVRLVKGCLLHLPCDLIGSQPWPAFPFTQILSRNIVTLHTDSETTCGRQIPCMKDDRSNVQ